MLQLHTSAMTLEQQALGLEGDEDLSDEQIQALLHEAEARLRQKPSQALALREDRSADFRLPSLVPGHIAKPQIHLQGNTARADATAFIVSKDKKLADHDRKIEDPVVVKKRLAEEKKATAGPMWFNLPRIDMTPELKRDLQVLKMRGVLDPKRHYKKENGKAKAPEYAQVGTIIEGNTEFFSARINNKDRKRTLVEEVLASEAQNGRFKRKYNEVQAAKTSGKKAFYKALKAKRKGKVEEA